MKFLEAMKYQIVLQQFLLIAPFRVANNRVKSSVTHNVYIIFMTSCFLINIAIAAYIIRSGFDGSDKLRFGNGYLWGIIGIFELTFSNISFPILVIHTLINRCHQINFLNKICEIDETLNEKFGVDTNRLNDYQRWRSYFFIVWSNFYYWTLYYLTFVYVIPPDLYSKWGLMMILVANQMEQSSMGLLTWTIIYYCTIIRLRFVMLESINMVEILRSENVKRKRQLMATWLTVYQDLCRLIEKMNTGWGLVIATRYSHDFTLLISQMYLMYWIVEQGRQTYVFIFVLYWSIQNVLKLLGMGLSADMATREAYECAALAMKLNSPDADVVVKQMLNSFSLWMLHRKIRFTANNFFTVDLTLVYSVVGALASYLLILIQFKQQEDSMIAIETNVTFLNQSNVDLDNFKEIQI